MLNPPTTSVDENQAHLYAAESDIWVFVIVKTFVSIPLYFPVLSYERVVHMPLYFCHFIVKAMLMSQLSKADSPDGMSTIKMNKIKKILF